MGETNPHPSGSGIFQIKYTTTRTTSTIISTITATTKKSVWQKQHHQHRNQHNNQQNNQQSNNPLLWFPQIGQSKSGYPNLPPPTNVKPTSNYMLRNNIYNYRYNNNY